MKITDYPRIEKFDADDVLLVDGNEGTRTIPVTDAILSVLHNLSPHNHRRVFRGKYLGTGLTTAQKAAIQAGTFEDLWLGDYWTINGMNWRIADFDYWYNTGDGADSDRFRQHHLLILPDTFLYTAAMNPTNTTEGGYVGSQMYTSGLESAKTVITAAFGSAVLTHRNYLINGMSGGAPSTGAWYDSTVELMNECMAYGAYVHVKAGSEIKRYSTDMRQLALFSVAPRFLNNATSYWLRDPVSDGGFANVGYYGTAGFTTAATANGVRPVFAIG